MPIPSSVDTTIDRVSIVKAALIGTTIVVGIGALALLQSTSTIHTVRGNQYTDNEYQQLKAAEISFIQNRAQTSPTFEEAEIWKEIVTQECGSITLHNVTSETLIDQLNNYLNNGCK